MAESYLGEESVEFCQEFVNQSCTTAGLRKDAGKISGPLSVVTMKPVEEKERDEAHLHVLLNNPEVHPYILITKAELLARDRERDAELEKAKQEMERTRQEMERTREEMVQALKAMGLANIPSPSRHC
ncbi:hypothetical protein POM88_028923 [Heracleum sosnowskyi]|uniref:Uncharacterized protein n=1 Tax=Heracleum sosnowskyi TaxID=360622 RepID=A0AAD8HV87_9APIA|nr:hypothetical protein POM88_028923 [Heracleum sosnowskyi]